MKKSIVALLTLFLIIACNSDKKDKNLHITGTVKGLKKGTLYIQRFQDSSLVALDTIIMDGNSNFESDIHLDSPEMLYLFLDRGVTNSMDNNILFFAEPGKMNISTDIESFLSKVKITGSKNQELYDEFKKIKTRFNDEHLTLVERNIKALKENNPDTLSKLQQDYDKVTLRKYRYAANFALTNADHEIAPYIALTEIYDANIKYLDTIKKSMSPSVAKSKYGQKLTEYIAERKKEQK
ncbi:DUF4369 domain-containing protein [Flavobacterium sp. '19STA2R22 D10 B1']|uniref:DUF4369 domain-containing protein n=1 Tax=Flavobacterium aerium TaxID=3037261 RepID=UPI00278C3365|nr:DUF4369 domain-containing protein [Flavobacterium sp. '19STA2R22 D10 B1']